MVATPFVKRKQQVLKPRGSPDMVLTLKPSLSKKRGQKGDTPNAAQRRPNCSRIDAKSLLYFPLSWHDAYVIRRPPGSRNTFHREEDRASPRGAVDHRHRATAGK
jgi:hypothetical protein